MKVIDYIIEIKSTPAELQESVKKKMLDGYEPLGGVAVTIDELSFTQALIKHTLTIETDMKYDSWCCQKCGEPIGWIGRFLFGGLFHRCPRERERTIIHRGNVFSYVGPKPEGTPVVRNGSIRIKK